MQHKKFLDLKFNTTFNFLFLLYKESLKKSEFLNKVLYICVFSLGRRRNINAIYAKQNYQVKIWKGVSVMTGINIIKKTLQFQASKIIWPFIEISVRRFRDWVFLLFQLFFLTSISEKSWAPECSGGLSEGKSSSLSVCSEQEWGRSNPLIKQVEELLLFSLFPLVQRALQQAERASLQY